jgi:hypothetical protein
MDQACEQVRKIKGQRQSEAAPAQNHDESFGEKLMKG